MYLRDIPPNCNIINNKIIFLPGKKGREREGNI